MHKCVYYNDSRNYFNCKRQNFSYFYTGHLEMYVYPYVYMYIYTCIFIIKIFCLKGVFSHICKCSKCTAKTYIQISILLRYMYMYKTRRNGLAQQRCTQRQS